MRSASAPTSVLDASIGEYFSTLHLHTTTHLPFLSREIFEMMVSRFMDGQCAVYDGRKNVYSRQPLVFSRDKVLLASVVCILLTLLIVLPHVLRRILK